MAENRISTYLTVVYKRCHNIRSMLLCHINFVENVVNYLEYSGNMNNYIGVLHFVTEFYVLVIANSPHIVSFEQLPCSIATFENKLRK